MIPTAATITLPTSCRESNLPRHGTTILVKDAGPGHADKAGKPMTVAELRWNRSAFELHPIR